MQARSATLDDTGAGSIGVPPCRWAGTQTTDATFTNLGRALNTGLLDDEDSWQLVNGVIAISSGVPGATVTMYFSRMQ
jgi:hypothetical protein